MSVRVMADVWDAGPDDPVDSSVLVALANHCDDDGRSCFPSVGRVALMVRRSQRTVERSIAALEVALWIKVERGGGRGVFSSYTVNVEMLSERAAAVRLKRSKERQGVAVSAQAKRRQPRQEKATATTEKATATPSYKEEPSWNHQENQNSPQPPAAQGECGDSQAEPACRTAPGTVASGNAASDTAELERWGREALRRMGVADPRDRQLASVVAAFRLAWGEEDLASAAARAAESWAELRDLNNRNLLLKGMPGVGEFFRIGMWRDPKLWPVNSVAWERERQRVNRRL